MIHVAVSMLVGDRVKYAGVVLGIAITTFLTTLVGSMFAGMMSRTFGVVSDNPSVDIWVTDAACETATQTINIPDTALERVRSVAGVAEATPLALGSSAARLANGRFFTVDVVGVDDATLRGVPENTPPALLQSLRSPQAVLMDEGGTHDKLVTPLRSEDSWARGLPRLDAPVRRMQPGDEFLVNNAVVRIAGEVRGGPRFQPQAVVYTTYSNAARVLPPQRHRTTFVLVRVVPGTDPRDVAARITTTTGLRARTAEQFKRDTVVWFLLNSEFAGHILVIVVFASIVGFTITALMLYMFTMENAKYYAVLKALGAGAGRLVVMTIVQALLGGAIGFGTGLGACVTVGLLLATGGFPFRVMWFTPLAVGVLVLLVTTAAAVMSARAVSRTEAGMVFK